MKQQSYSYFIAWRFFFVLGLLFVIILALVCRIFNLTILNQHFLRNQGDKRALRLVSVPAFRGMIIDRNGVPLAVSTLVYSIWANPKELVTESKNLITLSHVLGSSPDKIKRLIGRYQKMGREFTYLKRELSPDVAAKIKSLAIPGIYLQKEYRRFYPKGEVTAQVVGFTNIDDHGQEGIELAYNDWLAGQSGKQWVLKDRLGHVIQTVATLKNEKSGHDLMLSIDDRIQYIAYRELMQGVIKYQASSGSIVVLDAKTGEVLAMANYPSFNPNRRPLVMNEYIKNRAVTDLFEPGSTIKAFSIASALDSGKYKPNTLIDTYPGWMRVGHNIVKDERNHGPLMLSQILQISSNVGITRMVLSLSPDHLWDLFHRVGFGEETHIEFPGEQSGVLPKYEVWNPFVLATLGFGYGLSVTTIQLARAYNVLANAGVKLPITLLPVQYPPKGEQVMKEEVAKQMLSLLEFVVTKGGTAISARVSGYHVAGKTGTVKIVGEHGYQAHRYVASFVGIAPVSSPRLVVAVVIHDPQGKEYYGGLVAGPIFKKIMERSLRILGVPPDNESDLTYALKSSPVTRG